jgi:hypothetical protein
MYEKLLNEAFETTIQIAKNINHEEIKLLIKQEDNCNKALNKWLVGEIDEETFLDILEANGHTMDVSLKVFDENLNYLGV